MRKSEIGPALSATVRSVDNAKDTSDDQRQSAPCLRDANTSQVLPLTWQWCNHVTVCHHALCCLCLCRNSSLTSNAVADTRMLSKTPAFQMKMSKHSYTFLFPCCLQMTDLHTSHLLAANAVLLAFVHDIFCLYDYIATLELLLSIMMSACFVVI